jgi:hypothetical protein
LEFNQKRVPDRDDDARIRAILRKYRSVSPSI